MLTIRLTRVGKRNSPSYRVVVAEKKRAVKRKFVEIIGNYNPTLKPKQLAINKDRAVFWMERGAKASDTVNNLMADLGILAKNQKIKKIYGKKLSKKEIKEGAVKKPESKPLESAEEKVEKTEESDETAEQKPEIKEQAQEEAKVESENISPKETPDKEPEKENSEK